MPTIADRIIQVVDMHGGNMSEFARTIGVTPAYVSKLKNKPDSVPSENVIKRICDEYHIRREWIETGEGPMTHPLPVADTDVINDLLMDVDDPVAELIRKIYRTYKKLPAEDQQTFQRFVASLLNEK